MNPEQEQELLKLLTEFHTQVVEATKAVNFRFGKHQTAVKREYTACKRLLKLVLQREPTEAEILQVVED